VHQNDVNGEPCGIAVGFFKTASRICTELKEQFMEPVTNIACMDFGRCAWRTESYPEYKGGRKKPEVHDFLPQMAALEQALPHFGFKVIKALRVEADDLLGVASYELEKRTDEPLCILSSDKDTYQLITDRVAVYDFGTNLIVNEAKATEILGIPPNRLVEMKALAGDSSDNIPGAKGIGQKGALEILNTYPDLQALLHKLEFEAPPEKGVLKKLAASIADVRLAGKLCTIAQTPEQLWTEEARVEVEKVVKWAMGPPRAPLDDMVLEAYSDLWRVRDAETWKYAFS